MAVRRGRPYTETKDYIRIEGDAVKLVTESVSRVFKLDDFLNGTTGLSGLTTPVLPNNCRFFKKRGDISLYVIEKPPQTRQLTWVGMHSDTKKISWRLAFPFTVFILAFKDTALLNTYRLFYRTAPITTIQDELYHVNLGNVYLEDKICSGGIRVPGMTHLEKAEGFIAAFWQSQFNTDLLDHWCADSKNPQLKSLEAWEAASKEDPFFPVTQIKWRKAETIEKITDKMITGIE